MWKNLKRLDVHTKAMDGIQVKSLMGAILTVVSGILMVYLFISEFVFYRTTSTNNHLFVDTSYMKGAPQKKVDINIDVFFTHMACDKVHVDVHDEKGDHQVDIHNGVTSTPEENGCRITGTIHVNKLKGSCQFAVGKGIQQMDRSGAVHHAHAFSMSELTSFNVSHSIRHLSFGPDFPGLFNPLDGSSKVATGTTPYSVNFLSCSSNANDCDVAQVHPSSSTT